MGLHPYRAFKALAYKRYQHVPIYLEWAPANIFTADAPKQQPAAQTAKATDAAATAAGGDAPAVEAAAAAALPDTEEADTSTIYIKNLAFATGQDAWDKNRCVLVTVTSIVIIVLPITCVISLEQKDANASEGIKHETINGIAVNGLHSEHMCCEVKLSSWAHTFIQLSPVSLRNILQFCAGGPDCYWYLYRNQSARLATYQYLYVMPAVCSLSPAQQQLLKFQM